MIIGNKKFDFEKEVYIMGILNVTPDSFSDGGRYNYGDLMLKRAEKLIEEGASIIDVGGESTRPGYTMISCEEEIDRVIPCIERIKKEFDAVISIDTYKSRVAKAAIDAGASMINDIWGLKYDKEMADVAAKSKVAVCLMHNRNLEDKPYRNFMADVIEDMAESVKIGLNAGIEKEKIILDPGVGFAKNYEQNMEVMKNLERIKQLGYPVLLGTSRKSVIGITLGLPVEERLEGTLATTAYGVIKGCCVIRVHDVLENIRVAKMTKTIVG